MEISNEQLRSLLHNVISCYRDHINVYRTANPEEEAVNDVMEAIRESAERATDRICSNCGELMSQHVGTYRACKNGEWNNWGRDTRRR